MGARQHEDQHEPHGDGGPSGPPRPGPTNGLTDVRGVLVGHADRSGDGWLTGTTVILAGPQGAVGGVDVRGGGPGTRETDLLDPRAMVERVHAIVLSGGSAYGLEAATGVMGWLEEQGVGLPVGPGTVVPIVPGAVLFDLGRGGDARLRPDASFGRSAAEAATASPVAHGCVGAGTGAVVGGLKGGVGSASQLLDDGSTVAALVVVNAVGSAVDPATGSLWADRLLLERDGDLPTVGPAAARQLRARFTGRPPSLAPGRATTLVVVATDTTLTKAGCAKVASMAHDGLARSLDPVHTMLDGDVAFTLSTCERPAPDALGLHQLLTAAGRCTARAVARAVLAATGVGTPAGVWPSYRDLVSG